MSSQAYENELGLAADSYDAGDLDDGQCYAKEGVLET